ncbi:hypothetical protein VIBNIAM115_1710012 [Vibrio nigripulchritudo AM115]|nr:hypothetical protein VIBNIAM115_1710012 [Vibrio nigripulchritudo AM115]
MVHFGLRYYYALVMFVTNFIRIRTIINNVSKKTGDWIPLLLPVPRFSLTALLLKAFRDIEALQNPTNKGLGNSVINV